jgi:hypothetical protein
MFLSQSEEVSLNAKQAEHLPSEMVRAEGGITFIDHTIVLGFISISPNAVLISKIWLRNSTGSSSVELLPGVT